MKSRDEFYYDNLVACAECSKRASLVLDQTLRQFSSIELKGQMEKMHEIEREGDTLRHSMVNTLYKAFITPIEREDLLELSSYMDDITDMIEDVLLQLCICGVQSIKENALQLSQCVVGCCKELRLLMDGLKELKKGDKLKTHIIKINDLEEEADQLYLESMRKLHVEYSTAIEVIVWREIYGYLEKCMDACEHVADLVERIMIKNS